MFGSRGAFINSHMLEYVENIYYNELASNTLDSPPDSNTAMQKF